MILYKPNFTVLPLINIQYSVLGWLWIR